MAELNRYEKRLLGNPVSTAHAAIDILLRRVKELEENKASHDVRCNRHYDEAEEREQDLGNRITDLEAEKKFLNDGWIEFEKAMKIVLPESKMIEIYTKLKEITSSLPEGQDNE